MQTATELLSLVDAILYLFRRCVVVVDAPSKERATTAITYRIGTKDAGLSGLRTYYGTLLVGDDGGNNASTAHWLFLKSSAHLSARGETQNVLREPHISLTTHVLSVEALIMIFANFEPCGHSRELEIYGASKRSRVLLRIRSTLTLWSRKERISSTQRTASPRFD